MAWPVRSAAQRSGRPGRPCRMQRLAAEGALVDLALVGTREGHAVVLELDDGAWRLLAHVVDRVLVAQPVAALDRVVHVPPADMWDAARLAHRWARGTGSGSLGSVWSDSAWLGVAWLGVAWSGSGAGLLTSNRPLSCCRARR